MSRPFRFGLQLRPSDERSPVSAARRAEDAGFDLVLVADHIGTGDSPMVTLAAIAEATLLIRLGTCVLNNEMRNPVQVAWEAATIDRLSAGRFELGLGAGHTPQEFAATGTALRPAWERKARLMESVEVIRRLLDGDEVTFHGEHVAVDNARIPPPKQRRLPILVGGNGRELLAHAGAHADIVGLQGIGRTLPDGHHHVAKWDPAWLDEQVGQVRSGAGDRFAEVELNALVQIVSVTDDREAEVERICGMVDGLLPHHVDDIPYLLVGSVDEIVEKLHRCRERWGITNFTVRELGAFAPVITAMR